ncbi:lithostathine-like [Anableps anableps]
MRVVSVSCFGFTIWTLALVFYLPVTDGFIQAEETDNPYGFTCPAGWKMHNTQCLLFVPRNMTWSEAKNNCKSGGRGSLADVLTDIQADEIHNEMKKAGHHVGQVWVGGSRTSGDESWSWSDYSFFGYLRFCEGQSAGQENNCLQLIFNEHGSGCLNAMQCNVSLPSVCGILLY